MEEKSDTESMPVFSESTDIMPMSEGQEEEKISKEEQIKMMETITKFRESYREFREERENNFKIDNPNYFELNTLIDMWRQRPTRSEKFLLNLELTNCSLPPSIVEKMFDPCPSIRVINNEKPIEVRGMLFHEGDNFYEGTDNFMTITSQINEFTYVGATKEKQFHGLGVYYYKGKKNGFQYKGDFHKGKMHGKGEHRTNKNVQYIGEFRDDYKEGQGREVLLKKKKNATQNGEVGYIEKAKYEGEFKAGERHGRGVETTANYIYIGEWRGGVKCGHGEIQYKNGDSYKGEWESNEFNGEGEYIEKNNSIYKGQMKSGKYQGEGVMEYENGDRYEGMYENGKKHGQGTYTWADGDYYDGEWRNDSAEGHGTSMLGADFYDGDFKNGKRHGLGELTNEQGDVIKAVWECNEMKQELERNGEPVQ